MESKDTVTKEWGADYDANCGQEICCSILPRYLSGTGRSECYQEIQRIIYDFTEMMLEAQAEISFKAGYNQGLEEAPHLHNQCKLSYGAGIKEVVDWTAREFGVDWSEEKEQLEKWGIENE